MEDSSSTTTSSSSSGSPPPAASRASRRLRGLAPSDAAHSVRPSSSPAAGSAASSPASISEPAAFVYESTSGSSTSVGSASVPGSPAPSPAASLVPFEQPMRDAGVVTFSWPSHIGVPPPAGVPVDSPVPGSPRSPNSALPQRPSSSTRQVLVPYDLGPSSSSHGKAPALRGSSAASPVGDAASPPNDDDHALSDDVAVSTPPLDAGSSPVVLPGSPVSPASSPSPPTSVDEAAVVADERDEVPEQPESDNATLRIPPDHTRLLEDQARLLRSLLWDPPSDESWAQCEEAWTQAVALACRGWCVSHRRLAEIRDALGKEENSRPGRAPRCSTRAGNAAPAGGWTAAAWKAAFPGRNLDRLRPTLRPAVSRLPLLRLVPSHKAHCHVMVARGPIVARHLYGPSLVIS
ncbi:hypothetical protein HPB51_007037 [Rhipicephalus microplus]|uniref:Uncharacterized protein n=1 Tax=Rhipicephalus microplus TaxID=6941 RepID=A0A9J6E0H3_RHIMP|nr:hypothetical protein HPB51_007037 [Rhipicephalus microplus]